MSGGFDSLGLLPELVQAVSEMGYLLPTDVQDEAIPLILGGGDVMVAAETGSGKTAAFCLPIIQCVYETLSNAKGNSTSSFHKEVTITMDSNDKDQSFEVGVDGLTCSSSNGKIWAGARATHGILGGKYYFEVHVTGRGICRVGWSTKNGNLELGRDTFGFGYGGTSKKSHNNQFEDYGEPYNIDDYIGCFVDYDSGLLSFMKNGKSLGLAYSIPNNVRGRALFPAILLKSSSVKLNFTDETFRYPPPTGFRSIKNANTSHLTTSPDVASHVQTTGKRRPLAIILEPARDLAEQVMQNIQEFSRYVADPTLKTVLLVGGDDGKMQQKLLSGGADIVVATVGKAEDMFRKGSLDLSQVSRVPYLLYAILLVSPVLSMHTPPGSILRSG